MEINLGQKTVMAKYKFEPKSASQAARKGNMWQYMSIIVIHVYIITSEMLILEPWPLDVVDCFQSYQR